MYLIKHLIFSSLVIAGVITTAFAQFTVKMPYKSVTVKDQNGVSVFEGAYSNAKPGEPALPSYQVSFLLPPGITTKDVQVSIDNWTESELSGEYNVQAVGAPRRQDGSFAWPEPGFISQGKDTRIYGTNALYPTQYRGKVSIGLFHQYGVADIQVYPYRYNPVTKKLRLITGGILKVTINGTVVPPTISRNQDAERVLRLRIVNPEILDQYGSTSQIRAAFYAAPSDPLMGASYVIVVPNVIQRYSTELLNYKTYLEQRGARVTFYNETNFDPNGNITAQQKVENIRNLIKNKYQEGTTSGYPLKNVLLIGNPNLESGDVPMKKYKNEPTDFYYSDISGDWTLNGSDNNGEISVGRIPCYSGDYSGLDKILRRTIDYQNKTGLGFTGTESRRTFMTATVPVGFSGRQESYELGQNLCAQLKPKGWRTYRLFSPYGIWASDLKLDSRIVNMSPLPEQVYCTVDNVIKAWQTQRPGLIVWYGHGWPGGTADILESAQTERLAGASPAVVFALSCSTSDPYDPKNLGVMTLTNVAVAYIGAAAVLNGGEENATMFTDYISQGFSVGEALKNTQISNPILYITLYGCPEVTLDLPVVNTFNAPQNFKVAQTSNTQATLTWDAVAGCRPHLQIQTNEQDWKAYISLNPAVTSYIYDMSNFTSSTKTRFRITSLDENGLLSATSTVDSCYRTVGMIATPRTPQGLRVTGTGSSRVFLAWDPATNAKQYNVKRSTSASGPFVTIATVAELTFDDINLINGTTYYYVVSGVNYLSQSGNSEMVSAQPIYDRVAPSIKSIAYKTNSNGANIYDTLICNWDTANGNAMGYIVKASVKNPDGTWQPYYEVQHSGMQRFDRYARNGEFYFPAHEENTISYRMYSFNNSDTSESSQVYTFVSAYQNPPGTPVSVSASSVPQKVTVKWSNSSTNPLPTSYLVFYKKNTNDWRIVNTGNAENTYSMYASTNSTYKVAVRACYTDANKVSQYSPISSVATATTNSSLLVPEKLAALPLPNRRIRLVWISGGEQDGAKIEQATSASGPFTQIAVTTNRITRYIVSGLSDKKQYWFRVRDYKGTTNTAYSNIATATTIVNIAPGMSVKASSQESSTYSPAKGNDNSTTTRWAASSSSSLPQWWRVDLGGIKSLGGTEVMWETTSQSQRCAYIIESSTDDVKYDTIYPILFDGMTNQTQTHDFPTSISARYIRIRITEMATSSKPSFYEFRVFGR